MPLHLRLSWLLLLAGCRFEAFDPLYSTPAYSAPTPPGLPSAATLAEPAASAPDASASAIASASAPVAPASSCRSPLPFKVAEPPSTPPEPEEVTTQAIVHTCEAIARRSRARAGKALETLDDFEREHAFDSLLRCHKAGKNAWTFEVTAAPITSMAHRGIASDENAVRVTFHVRPVFVRENGTSISGREILLLSGNARFVVYSKILSPRFFDWDGDGRDEIYFLESHDQEENNADASLASRFWVFSARGDAVREVFPEAARADAIRDLDGDGRPDLVMGSAWVMAGPCGGIAGAYYSGPQTMLHSLPGGKFSRDDEVTRGFIAHQCRELPELYLEDDRTKEELMPPFLIGCQRWWGKTPEEILKKIRTLYQAPEEPLQCLPRKELERIARIAPPSRFRLSCR